MDAGPIREVLEGEEGGEGTQIFCVSEMARPDFPNCKFRFPAVVTLFWRTGGPGGGRYPPPPPTVYGHSNTFLVGMQQAPRR